MSISTVMIGMVLLPLVLSIVMAALPAKSSKVVFEGMNLASLLVILVCAIILAVPVVNGASMGVSSLTGASGTLPDAATAAGMVAQVGVISPGGWLRVDPLSLVFVCLIAVIGLLVGIYSVGYVRHDLEDGKIDASKVKTFYAFYQLFIFTMLLAATTNNIIMMWVAIEATTLGTVFLVGIYGSKLALEAAWKYVIICATGVAFGLYGVLLVYSNAAQILGDAHAAAFWTSVLPVASQLDPTLMAVAFVFTLIGFGTKAGLFPMHTWLPDAHAEAPSPVSALLSGVLLKCAVLVIVRFYIVASIAVGFRFVSLVCIILGGLSIVVGAFFIFAQRDFKRKLAYSSSENVGVIVLCLGFGGIGILAALIHCVAHAFVKALMFCLSGNLLMKYHTRDLDKISGVIEAAPVTGVLMFLGLLALSGFPPFAMFWSEIFTVFAGLGAGQYVVVALVVIALTVVIAAFALTINSAVFKHKPEGMKTKELGPVVLVPEIILLCVVLWLGVCTPPAVTNTLRQAGTDVQLLISGANGVQGVQDSDSVQSVEIPVVYDQDGIATTPAAGVTQ